MILALLLITTIIIPVAFTSYWFYRLKVATDERFEIMHKIFDSEYWKILNVQFDNVTFEDHFTARLYLKNPRVLYSKEIQELMEWNKQ